MDDFVDPPSPPGDGVGYDAGIAADSAGNLYASGYEYFSTGLETWFTRRSVDQGVTWSTVDTLSFGGTTYAQPQAVTTDSGGNVYVVGQATTNVTAFAIWIVRKGTNNAASGGMGWATVDQFTNGGGSSTAFGVYCHPTAGVFVVGETPVLVKKRSR
jgi:hypothetical protein